MSSESETAESFGKVDPKTAEHFTAAVSFGKVEWNVFDVNYWKNL